MLSLEAIISAIVFRNGGTHQKDQHYHMCQYQEADSEGQESGRPKELHID